MIKLKALALTLLTFFTVQSAEGTEKDLKKFKALTMGIACNTCPQSSFSNKTYVKDTPLMHLSTLQFFTTYQSDKEKRQGK